MSSTYAGCSQETSRKKMKHLLCFLVLFLISGVGSFDLVIDEIPDVSISRQGLGLPSLLKSTSKLQLASVGTELGHCFTALLVSHDFSSTFSCKWDCSDNWFSPVICSVAFLILFKLR